MTAWRRSCHLLVYNPTHRQTQFPVSGTGGKCYFLGADIPQSTKKPLFYDTVFSLSLSWELSFIISTALYVNASVALKKSQIELFSFVSSPTCWWRGRLFPKKCDSEIKCLRSLKHIKQHKLLMFGSLFCISCFLIGISNSLYLIVCLRRTWICLVLLFGWSA